MTEHVTAQKDKVPVKEKLLYGAGSGSFQMAGDGVKQLINPIFNITLGVSPAMIGLVLMFRAVLDAFTDPIMGKISDATRSRFGRRRPYIFIGALLTAMAFMLIWRVPVGMYEPVSDLHALFFWLLFTMLLFSICTTIQNVPYHTLGLEMTPDYHERTSVASYKMFFSFVFILFVPWVYRVAQADMFDGVMPGVQTISWFIAGAIFLGGILPALFVKERYYKVAQKEGNKARFIDDLRMTFKNKSFLIVTGIILTSAIGSGMVNILGLYIIFYYVYGGDTVAGSQLSAIGANVFTVAAIISLPLVNALSKRIGKVPTMRIMVYLAIIGSLSKFFLYNQEYPYLLLFNQIMMAPLAAGFWTLATSMKADVCDDDEHRHGMRREGMFGSIGNWITKMSGASIALISMLILEATGFDIKYGAEQPEEALLRMRILFSLIPAAFVVFDLWLLKIYPLTHERMIEIRKELEERRSTVN